MCFTEFILFLNWKPAQCLRWLFWWRPLLCKPSDKLVKGGPKKCDSSACCLQAQGFWGRSAAALTQNLIKRSLSYQKTHTNIVRMKIPTEMRNRENPRGFGFAYLLISYLGNCSLIKCRLWNCITFGNLWQSGQLKQDHWLSVLPNTLDWFH